MQFHIATTSRTTGDTLQALVAEKLRAEGVRVPDAHVCYGVGYTGNQPSLNKRCSDHNKLQQGRILSEGLGLEALVILDTQAKAEAYLRTHHRLVGRATTHSRGKDIKIALETWQVAPLMASGTTFFTPYVDSVREFRTWVYRKRHLGTYEKVLRRQQDFKRIGRNHDNGFDFSGVENDQVSEALKEVARKAIRALKLDFGAVDVIQKPDGSLVVLEVNSAPGVSDERRKVIQNLAQRISRWVVAGCPARED